MYNEQKKVLLLEDDNHEAGLLIAKLTDLGYEPLLTQSKQGFLEKSDHLSPYAIILDNTVPFDEGGPAKYDVGINLAKNLLREGTNARIALHTSDSKDATIETLESQGVTYMKKPVSREILEAFLK